MAQDTKVQSMSNMGLGFGITSLVTGVIAFLTGWIFFISIPVGAVAIVFGAINLKKQHTATGLAIAGLVSGIVGAAFGIGILALAIIGSINAGAPSVPTDPQPQTILYHSY